jgi:hypothetical protein
MAIWPIQPNILPSFCRIHYRLTRSAAPLAS